MISLPSYRYTLDAIDHIATFSHGGKEFQVACASESGYHPSHWSFCDEVETRELWWDIRPGETVLDIGADFGSYTLAALAAGAERVLAWSPPFKVPEFAFESHVLRRSIDLNGWTDRCNVYSSGLWSNAGWMAAFDGPRPARVVSTEEDARDLITGQDGHCSIFHVLPLDMAVPFGTRVDWIKVDTEGCELEILKGAVATIADSRPKILLEHHYHVYPTCEQDCDAWLLERGYRKVGTRPHYTIAHSLYVPE